MLELVLGGFLGGLTGAVPKVVADWIGTRNSMRIEYQRNQFDIEAQRRRVETARQLHEAELAHRLAKSYPLGTPGRLRSMLSSSTTPTLLISPAPPACAFELDGVTERVRELLLDVPGFTRYAVMPSGAFARDAGVSRFVDGEVGARTVAEAEFMNRPAILVYFEASTRTVTAQAYLSAVFDSVGGEAGFPFTVARYGMGTARGSGLVPRDTDLPSWHQVDLTRFPDYAPVDIVAATVGWFLLSVVDTYWELTTGAVPGLLASSTTGDVVDVESPSRVGPGLLARLEREAPRLADLGYEVATEELAGGHLGLHLTGRHDIAFVVDSAYPHSPPVAIQVNGTDVAIESANWSAECTLADIVEAFR